MQKLYIPLLLLNIGSFLSGSDVPIKENLAIIPTHTTQPKPYLHYFDYQIPPSEINEYAGEVDLNCVQEEKTILMAWAGLSPTPSSQIVYSRALLECGADQNIVINGNYALGIAVEQNNPYLVSLLLKYDLKKKLLTDAFNRALLKKIPAEEKIELQKQKLILTFFINNIKKRFTSDCSTSDLHKGLKTALIYNRAYAEMIDNAMEL